MTSFRRRWGIRGMTKHVFIRIKTPTFFKISNNDTLFLIAESRLRIFCIRKLFILIGSTKHRYKGQFLICVTKIAPSYLFTVRAVNIFLANLEPRSGILGRWLMQLLVSQDSTMSKKFGTIPNGAKTQTFAYQPFDRPSPTFKHENPKSTLTIILIADPVLSTP